MKVSKLLGRRFKETPSDSLLESYRLMIRGGYIKQVSNGVYSYFTPTKRISAKIEKILREEMDRIDGQEVLLPVVMPASLWEESGRYQSVDKELLRFTDRSGSPMVLGMTHEEAATQLARDIAVSYAQYPFTIYQIQTKFRDELRSRGGLIRVREFTMKDAYSFHTTQEDLEEYYKKAHEAYERIFARAGIPEVISVESDSGMMGGSVAHEFMLISDAGEDRLALCGECDFRSNLEIAETIVENDKGEEESLEMVETPNKVTIEDVSNFLKRKIKQFCKAVIYQKHEDDEYVVVFVRGDLDISEAKLRNLIGSDLSVAAEITPKSGLVPGYVGPLNLETTATVIYDASLANMNNAVCGANETNHHYTGFSLERDVEGEIKYHDVAQTYKGAICPQCGKKTIRIEKGIEVGNIFQLGTKYSKAMELEFTDVDGELKNPVMGCYGIGAGRLIASVCEEKRDKFGPIWPISIAPWHIHVCALKIEDERVKTATDSIYEKLVESGAEVLYDDRKVSAGNMFSDADLFGLPVRVIVSPRNCEKGVVEVVSRDKSFKKEIEVDKAVEFIQDYVNVLLEKSKI